MRKEPALFEGNPTYKGKFLLIGLRLKKIKRRSNFKSVFFIKTAKNFRRGLELKIINYVYFLYSI